MKKLALLLTIIVILLEACSDSWDNHYNDETTSDQTSNITLYEYFENEPSYQSFFELLQDAQIAEEMEKDQYLTVWAVKNENFDLSGIGNMDSSHVAKYHLNYLSLEKANLKTGLRIQTLNGIYLTISDEGNMVNNSHIISSRKFKNGVVHEIDNVMIPLINMFDYISLLGDEYSIIRDSILKYNTEVFDKKNSTPVAVDETGNTVYDSVFYTSNPLFEYADFSSEFSQFTLFLPNNKVMVDCFEKLKSQYDLMGKTFGAEDSVMAIKWIKEAIIHEGLVENYGETLDLTSPFGQIWRTSIQKIDVNSKKILSNGQVYEATSLKVPNNVIISRIKSLVYYYGFCNDQEKEDYYTFKGCTDIKVTQGDVSPVAGFYYWLLDIAGDLESTEEFSVEFTPIGYDEESGRVSVMRVPPGEYNLYMGFRSSGHPYVDVLFSSGDTPIADDATPVATAIPASQSTPWNYDRVNETDPNIRKWNGLGGLVGVVNIEGDAMSSFRIKVRFNKLMAIGSAEKMMIYHWTLKPTTNNY